MENEFINGQRVRYTYNNTYGIIIKKNDIGDYYKVKFNEGDIKNIPNNLLEDAPEEIDIFELFRTGKFQGIKEFRKTIYNQRLSGELTNILYSMNNAVTEFLPHQFIPVTKFLESYTDRLLIADEVGLGKTIEALYIWEELKIRNNAQRLIIVVPAMLRDKWKADLKKYFDIDGLIVKAEKEENLFEKIQNALQNPNTERFVLIISLEAIRKSEKIKKLLDDNQDINRIFDLVIIDEAHKLRNSSTMSYKIGEALRDVAESFLLLSATPIQTHSDNLFNLLSLLSPEDFFDKSMFEMQLKANIPLVRLTNALDRNDGKDIVQANLADLLLENKSFYNDNDIIFISNHYDELEKDINKRIEMVGKLKEKFFYSNYFTRTRKRDVLEKRTERKPLAINFPYSEYEKKYYDTVSNYLRNHKDKKTFSVFRLIMRQRQMASCLPASLRTWRKQGIIDNLEKNLDDDYIFDDLDPENDSLQNISGVSMPSFDEFDLDYLEKNDSKFLSILSKIKDIIKRNRKEKIIIFSFFRGTVEYVYQHLNENGIPSLYIIGGMRSDEKNSQIMNFRDKDYNVLVSSEVGAEGIDLQFAKYEINYDLPWNPMLLEQRIGRIDRIGQKSKYIYIFNAFSENTIEDKILLRLYERINGFKDSIGDIEEILGPLIRDLEIDIFINNNLTDEQIQRKTYQLEKAIATKKQLTKKLELESGILSAYQRYILDNIRTANDNYRYVTPEELMFTIKDFLNENFPGSYVRETPYPKCQEIKLSLSAQNNFYDFLRKDNYNYKGWFVRKDSEVLCCFDKKEISSIPKNYRIEIIYINHPIVRWLVENIKSKTSMNSGCSIISIPHDEVTDFDIQPGFYTYYIQKWISDGMRTIAEIHYLVDNVETNTVLSDEQSEKLMTTLLFKGHSYDINLITSQNLNAYWQSLERAYNSLWDKFERFKAFQIEQNRNLINAQKDYITRTYNLKLAKIQDTIDKLRLENKNEGVINMHEGRKRKVVEEKEDGIIRLEQKLRCNPINEDVAVGIIAVL